MPLPLHARYLILEALRKRPHSAGTLKEQLVGASWVDHPLEEYARFLGTLPGVDHSEGIYSIPRSGAATVGQTVRDHEWRMRVARRQAASESTTPERLAELVWLADDDVRLAVAANPSAAPEVLRALCLLAEDLKFLQSQAEHVRKDLAWFGTELPPHQLQEALREAVASNPSLKLGLAQRLRKQSAMLDTDSPPVAVLPTPNENRETPVVGAVARGRHAGPQHLWRSGVYRRQGADTATTANRLAEIVRINDDDLKMAIAANTSTGPATLWELCLVPRRIELSATARCAEDDPTSWFGGRLPSPPLLSSLRELVAANRAAPAELIWALTRVSPIVKAAQSLVDASRDHREEERDVARTEPAQVDLSAAGASALAVMADSEDIGARQGFIHDALPPEVEVLAGIAGLSSDGYSARCGDFTLWTFDHSQPVIGGRYVVTVHEGKRFRPQELSEILRAAEDLDAIRTIVVCRAEVPETVTAFAIGRPVFFVSGSQIDSTNKRQAVSTAPQEPATAPARAPADLVADVIHGATYVSQVQRAGRGAPSQALVASILVVLIEAGGKAHVDRISAAAGLSPRPMPSTLTFLKRVLNIDGYPVLEFEPRSGWVMLDEALLLAQFVR